MKSKWTCGRNTQVAKRKRENFTRALIAAICASMRTTTPVHFDDYMTRAQMRILIDEAATLGMEPGEWVHHILMLGLKASKEGEV